MLNLLQYITLGYEFPPLEKEIGKYKKYLRGRVLNAGSGNTRDISHLVRGTLINQDIVPGPLVDVVSPLDKIPFKKNYFDVIFCNAVIEHVNNPEMVMKEFYRVLKPRGFLYLCIPFLQPRHFGPTDYQRYTRDGIKLLTINSGFKIKKCEGIDSAYQTIGWIITEWLNSANNLYYRFLRIFLFPILRYKCRHSTLYIDNIATGYRILATK